MENIHSSFLPFSCYSRRGHENTRNLLKPWKQVEGLRIFFRHLTHHRSVQQIQQLGAHRLGLQYERGQGQVIQTDRIVPSGERHLLMDWGTSDIVNFGLEVGRGLGLYPSISICLVNSTIDRDSDFSLLHIILYNLQWNTQWWYCCLLQWTFKGTRASKYQYYMGY